MSEPVKQSLPSQNTSAASPEHEETKAHAARAVGGPERGRSQDQQDTQSLVTRFHTLFQGREDCYGQFTPLANGGKKATTEHGAIPPEAWTRHLAGEAPSLGVVPIVPGSNTCRWGVIDVDTHAGEKVLGTVDFAHLVEVVVERGFPLLPTRSRRDGAHLWYFSREPVSAAVLQAQLRQWRDALLARGAWDAALDVEIFPRQVTVAADKEGSWVNLPYFGAARVGVDSDGHDLALEDFLTRAEATRDGSPPLTASSPTPPAAPTAPRSRRPTVWTLDDAKAVLDRLKPERATDYHDRLKVGMALHHAGEGDDAWLDLWQAWNDRHCEPEPRKWVRPNGEYVKKWKGFDDAPGGTTMGTVQRWARDDDPDGEPEAQLERIVDTLNERYAVIYVEGKTYVIDEKPHGGKDYALVPMPSFYQRLRNRTIRIGRLTVTHDKAWLDHPRRRELPGGFVFGPPGADVPDGSYNLFRGWALDPDPTGDCSLFLDHILRIICDGNEEHFRWVMNWFAAILQRPTVRYDTSLVLRGKKGVGKSIVGDVIGGVLMGRRYHTVVSSPKRITGHFNAHLKTCLLLQAEEAFWAGDKEAEGALKHLITGYTQQLEHKGVDPITIDNYVHLLVTGNEKWLVPASMGDERRFAVFNVPETMRKNFPYFGAIWNQLKADGGRGYRRLLHELLTWPVDETLVRTIPLTAGLLAQQEIGLPPEHLWLRELLAAGAIPGAEPNAHNIVRADVLWESYAAHVRKSGGRHPLNTAWLGRWLPQVIPAIGHHRAPKDAAGRRLWHYIFPDSLADARRQFTKATGDPFDWGEDWEHDRWVRATAGGSDADF